MHLVGFIIKKFVTMHGHMNVKFYLCCFNVLFMFVFLFCISVFHCVYSVFLYLLCIASPFAYICLFPLIVQFYRPLPPGGNPIAVNKYHTISYLTLPPNNRL